MLDRCSTTECALGKIDLGNYVKEVLLNIRIS